MTDPAQWLSTTQAAAKLGVSRQYAHRLITSNPTKFRTATIGARALIVRVSDIEAYKEDRQPNPQLLENESETSGPADLR